METLPFPTTAADIGRRFGAQVVGPETAAIRTLDPLNEAREGSLTFLSHKKFEGLLGKVSGAVVFVQPELARPELPLTFILVPDPKRAFAEIAGQFTRGARWQGISAGAHVHPHARVATDAAVGPFAVIEEGAQVGSRSVVHPFAYVGRDAIIGEDSEIHPHVTVWDRVRIGNRVKIFAGSVIGSNGFGLLSAGEEGFIEMPHIGTVVIEDDVRIGAKCTIDRATLGETHIERGVKMDDQVHVGHNSRVGARSVLCAQVGLSGSTRLEEDVVLAGQVGVADGTTIGRGARLSGQAGTSSNLKGGEDYFGSPAMPLREAMKVIKYMRKLPEIWRRLKALEERLDGAKN